MTSVVKPRLAELALGSALLATPTLAQVTHVHLEASTDLGATWSSAVAAEPGREVSVRIRVRLDSAGTTMTSMGLGGLTLQPTLTNWTSGDSALAFADSLAPNALPSTYGRVYPFSSIGQTPGIPPQYVFFESGGVLRIANSRNIKAPGLLSWGLNCAQSPRSLNPTGYNPSLDVVVFRFGFVAGGGARTMIADADPEWVNNKRGTWYTTPGGTGPVQASLSRESTHPATITIVPSTPGLSCLALAAGWCAMSRARRRA